MTPEAFHQLLDMVQPYIQKQDTFMRDAITPYEMLAVTLRYLASGMNRCSLFNMQ